MAKLSPYLFFPGTCREAMNFYKDCIGGELHLTTAETSPMAAQMSKEEQSMIMHSILEKEGFSLMASDMMDHSNPVDGNRINLCLVCDSPEEIKSIYEKLASGGKATDPLKEEFFGTFGKLTDKFGIEWMLQYSPQNK